MTRIWAPILIIIGAVALLAGAFMPLVHYPGYDLKILDFAHDPRSVWLYQMGFVLPALAVLGGGILSFYRRSSWLYAAVAAVMAVQVLNTFGTFLAASVNSAFWGHPAYGLFFLFLGPACGLAGSLVGFLDEQGVIKHAPAVSAPTEHSAISHQTAPGDRLSTNEEVGSPVHSQSATKICPDCAEPVLLAARKCRHCGWQFEEQRLSA